MGGFSKQKSGGQSLQTSTSNSFAQGGNVNASTQDVWGAQVPALTSLFGGAQGLIGQQSQVQQPAQQAWESMLTPGINPQFSQALDAAIAQATQGFTRDVLPQLRTNAAGMGAYGGVRDQLAQGEAAGLFGQGLQRTAATALSDQWNQQQQQRLAALQMAPMIGGLGNQNLVTAAQVIGGPTVLGQSFGQGWNQAGSSSTSTGTSSQSSKGFGIQGK